MTPFAYCSRLTPSLSDGQCIICPKNLGYLANKRRWRPMWRDAEFHIAQVIFEALAFCVLLALTYKDLPSTKGWFAANDVAMRERGPRKNR